MQEEEEEEATATATATAFLAKAAATYRKSKTITNQTVPFLSHHDFIKLT